MNRSAVHKKSFNYRAFVSQVSIGLVIGVVIACSPTKFSSGNVTNCVSTNTSSCVVTNGYENRVEDFKVGAGKVDILFVDDNSASMSFEQQKMAQKFGGFVENLDAREIDYRIAVITTDLAATQQKKFITFNNGTSFLTRADSNRAGQFYAAIARPETLACENFIRGAIINFGPNWRSDARYEAGYKQNCPSPDERGIFTSHLVLEENTEGFVRPDANLNIIAVTDEDERSGQTNTFEDKDRFDVFNSMMAQKHSAKYWEFNSIIVKDATCQSTQSNQIVDANGGAVGASIGTEYAKISMSAATTITGNPRPRGLTLDICQSDFSQYFTTIAANITEAARSYPLSCKPTDPPTVERISNPNQTVNFTWDGNQRILFDNSASGIPVKIKYRCYKGPM